VHIVLESFSKGEGPEKFGSGHPKKVV